MLEWVAYLYSDELWRRWLLVFDFHELSDAEFERLVRDLLQFELGVRLETFGPGADRGIDCRYACGDDDLIVQAKHYLRSGKNKLVKSMRAEDANVKKLRPSRYVVATSVSMTPALKDKILSVMPNTPLDVSDILGLEDLNNLLARHDTVEQRYPQLWLKGSAILNRLAQANQAFERDPVETESLKRDWFLPVAAPLVGREDLTEDLLVGMAAKGPSMLLVLGAPAIGKTSLALQAANAAPVIKRFGRRRCFVRLDQEGASDVAAVQMSISLAIGRSGLEADWHQTLDALRSEPSLLIVDNLETCWEIDPARVEGLLGELSQTPGLTVCVTMRGAERPSRLRWDRVVDVPPLAADAVAVLFEQISGLVTPPDQNLSGLLHEMGGIPLAVELLAERAQYTPVDQLEEEWRRVRTRLLRRPGRALDKLSSLDISLELSFSSPRLSKSAKRLFKILGHLPAGVQARGLRAMMHDEAFAAASGLRRTRLGSDQEDRLNLLPPVREFAKRMRLSLADTKTLGLYFLDLIDRFGPRVGAEEASEGVQVLIGEGGNLESVLLLLANRGGHGPSPRRTYSAFCGLPTLLRHWLGRNFDGFEQGGCYDRPAIAAHSLLRSGEIERHRSQYKKALLAFSEAGELFSKVGQRISEATCIKCGADVLFDLERFEEAGRLYARALRRYHRRGSIIGEANCWSMLADVAIKQQRWSAAAKAVDKA